MIRFGIMTFSACKALMLTRTWTPAGILNAMEDADSGNQEHTPTVSASRKSATGSMGTPVLLQARPTPAPIGISRIGLGAGMSTNHFQVADMERLRKTAGQAVLSRSLKWQVPALAYMPCKWPSS